MAGLKVYFVQTFHTFLIDRHSFLSNIFTFLKKASTTCDHLAVIKYFFSEIEGNALREKVGSVRIIELKHAKKEKARTLKTNIFFRLKIQRGRL